tara:strand:- start:568 stop:1020 length:453 start_codon:yes stop_codon:yes gene_type:complete
MKSIFLLSLLFSPFYTFSWEYHGIKSGMTKEQLIEIPGMANKKKTGIQFDEKTFFPEGKPPGFYNIFFQYTSEGKLWRLDIYFRESSGIISSAVQKKILEELSDSDLGSERVANQYADGGYINYLLVQKIDVDLFREDVERRYQSDIVKY